MSTDIYRLRKSEIEDSLNLKRYLAGDANGLGNLYKKYNQRCIAYAYLLLHDKEEARDAAHEAWANVIAWPKLKHIGKFFTLLSTIIKHIAINKIHTKQRLLRGHREFRLTGGRIQPDRSTCRYCDRKVLRGYLCSAHYKRRSRGATETQMRAPIKSYNRW